MAAEKTKIITTIGGQALIEGIMMRGPQKTFLATRTPEGGINLEELASAAPGSRTGIWKWPLFRGVSGFFDSLSVGYQALSRSAEIAGLEEDGEEEESKFDRWVEEKFGDNMMKMISVVGVVLGVAIAVGLFFLLPTWLFNLLENAAGQGFEFWRSPVEGGMRLLIFLAYLIFCSLLPDIHRVFEYHGAEHKTIFCYENGEELTVENVKKFKRFHPRCGTSFLVFLLLLGILLGFFIPFTNPFTRTAAKLLCIPVVVGVGYELIRYCGRHDNLLTRIISAPGLWMQRITTKEPDDSMIEVAITALKAVIPENGEDRILPRSEKQNDV